MVAQETYLFGGFVLEVGERRLSAGGAPIVLAPKAFDVLVALVRRAGRLIGKQELLETLWAGSFVDEGILSVHVSALRKALGDTRRPPRYIETVSRSGYRFIAPVREEEADRRVIPGRWSIAVLPSRPLTGSTEGERLIGLAITDALIDRLGRFDPIVVRPTSAVHAFAMGDSDPAAAGRTLRTDAVVDSSFERIDDGLRVSAKLVRSGDGEPLWRGRFDDSPAAAASAVADAVASQLGVASARTSTDAPSPRVSRTRVEVYELCGRGRSHLLSGSMFEVPHAVDAFRAAVDLDPSYAPALAGLALAHCAQAAMRVALPANAYRDARAAALRALAVDDGSADAQVALGSVLFFAEWDWRGADQCLRRAIEINPNHVQGYLIYGHLLDALGRPEQALGMKLSAFERDPLSPLVHVQIALSYLYQRRYDEAVEWAQKALALDSRHLLALEFLAGAYLFKGDFDRYLTQFVAHGVVAGAPEEPLQRLQAAYAREGRSGFWRCSLEQMAGRPVPAMQLAVFYGQAGDIDAAFEHLDRAIDDHDPSLIDLGVAPQWDPLRADPRFNQRLARLALGG
jgi:DNA-binding winged helix-turn-helix (wHTH) protein/tetratricopeptide (TPR) repeat protein